MDDINKIMPTGRGKKHGNTVIDIKKISDNHYCRFCNQCLLEN